MKLNEQERERWHTLLASMKFFAGMSAADIDKVLAVGSVMHVAFHEYIFREGEVDAFFFVLLKGSVKILKSNSMGKKKEVSALRQGNCFGEMSLLMNEPRTASVLAAEECFVLRMGAAEMEALPSETRAKFYRTIAILLAERLKAATESLVSLNF
jgi:CRP-like cAMP-binding protein